MEVSAITTESQPTVIEPVSESTMSKKFFRVAGFLLLLIALLGYATVADDLRHVGEFMGVTAILISGLAFLAAGYSLRLPGKLAMQWVAIGVGIGAAVGAATDEMASGVAGGVALGLTLAYLLRKKSNQEKESVTRLHP